MTDHKPDILEAVTGVLKQDGVDDPDGRLSRAVLTVALDMMREPSEIMVHVFHTCPDHSARVRWQAMLAQYRNETLGTTP